MIVRAVDRLGTFYFETDEIVLVRAMPTNQRGEWTYVGLRGGREVELNVPLGDVLEWWGWEGTT